MSVFRPSLWPLALGLLALALERMAAFWLAATDPLGDVLTGHYLGAALVVVALGLRLLVYGVAVPWLAMALGRAAIELILRRRGSA